MAVRERTPDRALTPGVIVALAINHADTGGIEAVSMRKLSAVLSVTPMALYWHFESRRSVLDAMAEEVAGELAHDDDPDAPWHDRLRAVLMAMSSVFRAHPWMGPLVSRRIVGAPNYLGAMEVLLDTVRVAGYGKQAAVRVVDFAIDSVAALAAGVAGAADEPPPASQGQLEMRQRLLALAGTDYPRIREAAVPLTEPEPPIDHIELGIDVLVGGIQAAAPTS